MSNVLRPLTIGRHDMVTKIVGRMAGKAGLHPGLNEGIDDFLEPVARQLRDRVRLR